MMLRVVGPVESGQAKGQGRRGTSMSREELAPAWPRLGRVLLPPTDPGAGRWQEDSLPSSCLSMKEVKLTF